MMRLVDDPQMYAKLDLLSAVPDTFEPQFGNAAWQQLGFDELITLRINFGITGDYASMSEDELEVLFKPIRRDFYWWMLWRWFGYWRTRRKRLRRRAALEVGLRDQILEALQRTPGVTVWQAPEKETIQL